MNKLLLILGFALLTVSASAQIRMTFVDPANSLITIKNYGSTDVNIQNYRLCALFEYASLSAPNVLPGNGSFTLSPGSTVTVEWQATSGFNPTSSDVGLYLPTGAFSDPNSMVDFMQYGAGGQGRAGVAQQAGLWTSSTFLTGSGPWVYIGDGTQNSISYWVNYGGAGCTDVGACNYNPAASIPDNSCLYIGFPCDDGDPTTTDVVNADCVCTGIPFGCTDINACNYDMTAVEDDFSCAYPNNPCDDGNDLTANDAYNSECVCIGEDITNLLGCTDNTACNFNATATFDDGSCAYAGESCDDGDPNSILDVLSETCECVGLIPGCMFVDACNYNPAAGYEDGTCLFPNDACDDLNPATTNDTYTVDCVCVGEQGTAAGCTDMFACNYNNLATDDDGSCIYPGDLCDDGNPETINDLLGDNCACAGLLLGCADVGACNYDMNVSIDDGTCFFPGDICDDGNSTTVNDAYNQECTCEGTLIVIGGCTDETACNFNPLANTDDGSCQIPFSPCDDNNTQTTDDTWTADCTCEGLLLGCTDATACNYSADAIIEDFSCAFPNETCDDGNFTTINDAYNADCTCIGEETGLTAGCTEAGACNFNPAASIDDGSCLFIGIPCDDNDATTINDLIQSDCTCSGDSPVNYGCTDNLACNYNSEALFDDGSCISPGDICDDNNPDTFNDSYNSECSCVGTSFGCTDNTACNYDPLAGIDNGSCIFPGQPCDDGSSLTENDSFNSECVCIGIEVVGISGCTDIQACNYNAEANLDDGSCFSVGDACDDNNVTTDNDMIGADCVCMGEDNGFIGGCMDMTACNYVMAATIDDGSCYSIGDACDDGNIFTANDIVGADCICAGEAVEIVEGCTAIEACNYNPAANFDDGSCELPGSPCDDGDETTLFDVLGFDCSCSGMPSGCMDINACNYDASAMFDDSSCIFPGEPCDDGNAATEGDIILEDCSCAGTLVEVLGCVSPDACNYDAAANTDDGSCYFVGDPCDDGNANTFNDVYAANCECQGVVSVEEITTFYSVYPNPTSGIITIAQRKGAAIQLVEVVDITGKRVASFNPNASITTIDLNAMAQGLYTLNIRSNGEVKSVRVQKQ